MGRGEGWHTEPSLTPVIVPVGKPGASIRGAAEKLSVFRPGKAYGRALAGSPPSLVEIATRISAGVSSPMKAT